MKKSSERNVLMWTICAFGILFGGIMIWNGLTATPIKTGVCLGGALIIVLFILVLALHTAERDDSWKEFLEQATSKELSPKKTIELVIKAGNYKAAQTLLDRCIRYRIEHSGNYAWGLAFWVRASNDLSFEWQGWFIEIIHSELGLKLHEELDRVSKMVETGVARLSHPPNREYLARLLKKEIAMMLEVCGEDRPYKSILPILAEASVSVREEILNKARMEREFPKNADLTQEMIDEGNEAYHKLFSSLEEEIRNWPVAEPIS